MTRDTNLFAGVGMRLENITDGDLAIISNKAAIEVNQAWAGFAGDMLNYSAASVLPSNITRSNYSRLPTNSVWWKPLPNSSAAAVLYASEGSAMIGFELAELQYNGKSALPTGATGCASVKSIWEGNQERGPLLHGGRFSARVAAGDVVFVVLSNCA